MSLYEDMGLHQTVRVTAKGKVTRGIRVKHEAANIKDKENRIVATPPRHAKHMRFAPSGIPRGVDQTITIPHDCANHLEGGRFEVTPGTHVTPRPLA